MRCAGTCASRGSGRSLVVALDDGRVIDATIDSSLARFNVERGDRVVAFVQPSAAPRVVYVAADPHEVLDVDTAVAGRTLREHLIAKGRLVPHLPSSPGPAPMRWRDEPTLKLDDAGRRAAAERVELGKRGIADCPPRGRF
jgi:hypothetical protein